MKMCQNRMFLRLILLASLLTSFGCAQQMKSVQPESLPEASANAEIRSITVAEDASRVEITSDRPIVYTFYMLESPPRLVVDIAQATTGTLVLPIDVNKGSIKRVDASKHEFGSGILSRINIDLSDRVDAYAELDKLDKRRLILTIPTAGAVKTSTEAIVPVATPAPAAVVTETAPAASETKVESAPVVTELASQPKVEEKGLVPETRTLESVNSPVAEQKSPKLPVIAEPQITSPKSAVKTPGQRVLRSISKGPDGITLELSATADSFNAFKLSQPDRLVVDIAKTRNAIQTRSIDINGYNLGKARIGGTADKLRVVFDSANGPIPKYAVTRTDAGLLISFGDAAQKASQPAQVAEPAPVTAVAAAPVAVSASPVKATVSKPGTLEAVDFTQLEGISRITIRTTGSCMAAEPVKSAKGFSLVIKGCRLPAKLQRQIDTSGFESVIKSITPYPVKTKGIPETRIAVNVRGAAPNVLKRNDNEFLWEFREPVKPVKISKPVTSITSATPVAQLATGAPASPAGVEKELVETKPEPEKPKTDKTLEDAFAIDKRAQTSMKQGKQYTGRKVSLEFSDADIRKIFQLLAEVSNQNFLISDDVTGIISLKLVNVPWDQALDVILENKGLGMQKDGNIVQIRPKSKMKSLDEEALEMRLTEERKMPLSTVIFDINFATIGDIETQFRALKSKRSDSSVTSDQRTNKIIVVDIDPNIKKMRLLLESLDVPEKQVMIEARIVEASSNFARDIGVKWNIGYQDGSASVANINNASTSMGGVVTNVLPTGTTGGIATAVSFGKLVSNLQLDMRLSAAATVGQVKIISTPKVLTVNNKAAKISQGQMIPYQNTSSSEGAKTEFIEAALTLEVTPHITADGSVNMKIKASNNSAGAGSPPPINKKETTTELVVKNGETTVIGGIYVDSETEGETGVPFLSDIPLLGWLFKSNSKNKTKNELLIFITPKIVG